MIFVGSWDWQKKQGLHFATVSTITADLGTPVSIHRWSVVDVCIVLSYEVATDGARFGEYLKIHPINALKIVPSHLAALLGLQPKGREDAAAKVSDPWRRSVVL